MVIPRINMSICSDAYELKGTYFTNLHPRQTLGKISLKRTGRELRKHL